MSNTKNTDKYHIFVGYIVAAIVFLILGIAFYALYNASTAGDFEQFYRENPNFRIVLQNGRIFDVICKFFFMGTLLSLIYAFAGYYINILNKTTKRWLATNQDKEIIISKKKK